MKQIVYSRIIEGHMTNEAELRFLAILATNTGKDVKITVERGRKKRSLNQNAFFHGPFVESATRMFQDKGNDFDETLTKEIIKDLFGPKQQVLMPDGRSEYLSRSSADWTTAEAETVMEKARAWASGYGYRLPVPNEFEYENYV